MSKYNTKLNVATIQDQEDLMHRIYDVVHIGVSNLSLSFMLDSYAEKYNMEEILNSRLKDEKYSENSEYPICKVLYQDRSLVLSKPDDEFYKNKLNILEMIVSYGADISKVKESYSFHNELDLDYLKERKLIDDKIIKFLKLS
jgi:hypothetical protein